MALASEGAFGNTTWTECGGSTGTSCVAASAILVVHTNTATGFEFGAMAEWNAFGNPTYGFLKVTGFNFSNSASPLRQGYVFDAEGVPRSNGKISVYSNGSYRTVLTLDGGYSANPTVGSGTPEAWIASGRAASS